MTGQQMEEEQQQFALKDKAHGVGLFLEEAAMYEDFCECVACGAVRALGPEAIEAAIALQGTPAGMGGDLLPRRYEAQSQKARGIFKIREHNTYFSRESIGGSTLYKDGALYGPDGYERTPGLEFPLFARPCPKRPRHGFVDSRVVRNDEEWQALLEEVRQCDEPDCEIIIMEPIEAKWSGLLTEAGIALGEGNDGATSGHGSISIPAPSTNLIYAAMRGDKSAFGIEDSPYIELVAKQGTKKVEVVQVRDGPKVTLKDTWIPHRVHAKNIVAAEGDLMEWEEKTAGLDPKTTIVWHPGGNLSSHYAVHCALHNLAVTCQKERPVEGTIYKPNIYEGEHVIGETEAAIIREGIREGWRRVKELLPDAEEGGGAVIGPIIRFSAATLHAMPHWGNEPHLLRARGIAVGAACLASIAACLGESRHWYGVGPGRHQTEKMGRANHLMARKVSMSTWAEPAGKLSRESVFSSAGLLSPVELARDILFAEYDFKVEGWSSSYGGPAWHRCSKASRALYESMLDFLACSSSGHDSKWKKVASELNKVINVAHNGGNLLNKFLDARGFTLASEAASICFANDESYELFTADGSDEGGGGAPLSDDEVTATLKWLREDGWRQAVESRRKASAGIMLRLAREGWRREKPVDAGPALLTFMVQFYSDCLVGEGWVATLLQNELGVGAIESYEAVTVQVHDAGSPESFTLAFKGVKGHDDAVEYLLIGSTSVDSWSRHVSGQKTTQVYLGDPGWFHIRRGSDWMWKTCNIMALYKRATEPEGESGEGE